MRLTLALLLVSSLGVVAMMGEKEQPAPERETTRAGAKVIHSSPQPQALTPTRRASRTCEAVLGTIAYAQRLPSRGDSELTQLQADLRAEAAHRDSVRQRDPSHRAQKLVTEFIGTTYPEGGLTGERTWLQRDEAARDPISRLSNNDLCVNCAEGTSWLARIDRAARARCGLAN